MTLRWALAPLVIIAFFTMASCAQDKPTDPAKNQPEQEITSSPLFEDLTDKDDVLVNLQLAYDLQNKEQFAGLVDQYLLMAFSERDVVTGDVPIEQWDRAAELTVLPNLFGGSTVTGIPTVRHANGPELTTAALEERTWGYIKYYFLSNPGDTVSAMSLTLSYTAGDAYWNPFTDPGSGETWYEKRAEYVLTVETSYGEQFQTTAGEATFTVREIPGMGIYRLVRWSDDLPLYEDLKQKDDVLHNLRWAYNQRNVVRIDQLLNADFIFHFSIADYQQGYTPQQWDRASELAATSHMFDPYYPANPVTSINLDLFYPPGNWVVVDPPPPAETWYLKTVVYNLVVQAGELTYIALNTSMDVVVRFADAGGDSIWQIVDLSDDTNPSMDMESNGPSGTAVTEEYTWGRIKAQYQ